MERFVLAQALLLLLLSNSACTEAARTGSRPSIVLISIDSLRADHLGCYGYGRDTSPAIDRLAREGALFENAVSSTSWTLPAHASMFTGLPPTSHGCTRAPGLPADQRTLAEALRDHGYRTAGFWSGPYLHPVFDLDQGFDEYRSCASYDFDRPPSEADRLSHRDVTNPKVLAEVTRWLEQGPDQPFFLFVHMWDVHHDYIPPPPYDTLFDPDYAGSAQGGVPDEEPDERDLEHLIALYDGEIAWTDHHVQGILEKLHELALLDEAIVVLTADHGEEFYEHGKFGHRKSLYEESIAVPLIVRFPPAISSGIVVDASVSVTDIPATLLELAGLPQLPQTLGRSLVPLIAGGQLPEGGVAISELFRHGRDWRVFRASTWKVLVDTSSEEIVAWWDLAADPEERRNLIADGVPPEIRKVVEEKREELELLEQLHRVDAAEPGSLPPALEAALEDLGYVGDDD